MDGVRERITIIRNDKEGIITHHYNRQRMQYTMSVYRESQQTIRKHSILNHTENQPPRAHHLKTNPTVYLITRAHTQSKTIQFNRNTYFL